MNVPLDSLNKASGVVSAAGNFVAWSGDCSISVEIHTVRVVRLTGPFGCLLVLAVFEGRLWGT